MPVSNGDGSSGSKPGQVRRRDRHGRGMRGLLAPPDVPLHRSRAQQFGDLVLEAVARLEPRWEPELARIEFAVQEVPDGDPPGDEPDGVPLARLDLGPLDLSAPDSVTLDSSTLESGAPESGTGDPAGPAPGPRIVLYRRALLARADDEEELAELVLDVVVEEVARLLGVDPEVVDPGYDEE